MNSEKVFKLVWILFAVLFVCIIINLVLIFLFTGNSRNTASTRELKEAGAKIEALQRQVAELHQQFAASSEEGGRSIAHELLEGRVSILEKNGVGSDANVDQRLKQLEMKISTLEIAFKQSNGISAANAGASTTKSPAAASNQTQAPAANQGTVKVQTPPSANAKYHTVQAGENLFRISQKYGLTVEQLRRLNGMKENDVLKAGQRLVVAP